MAKPLKYRYNPVFFERFCADLSERIPGFDCRDFIFRIFNNEWPDMELNERVRHISTVLHHFLSKDFPKASQQLVGIVSDLRQQGMRQQSFENILLADYIEVYGLAHLEESMKAEIHKSITQRTQRRHKASQSIYSFSKVMKKAKIQLHKVSQRSHRGSQRNA